MLGSYPFSCESREARDEFVKRPDVWWYHYPEEDDDWGWHKGGAWVPEPGMVADSISDGFRQQAEQFMDENDELLRKLAGNGEQDEAGDERW